MKNKFLLFLPIAICASVYAEPRPLPPVIDNSTFPGGSAYAATAPSNNAMYEVLGRLEQMQHELQQLRGVVEEQGQAIANLKKRQGNIYSDLDQRLQALSTIAGQESGVQEAQNTEKLQKQSSSTQSQSSLSENNIESTTPALSEKQRYQNAYEILRNGHNSRAIAEFKALLKDFPAGEYADNAQYWLGEAYKVNKDIDSARTAFNKVVRVYPDSPKVPDALLKLGYIELEQNNIAKARDYLTQVTVSYPGTTAAHLATKKIRQLNQ